MIQLEIRYSLDNKFKGSKAFIPGAIVMKTAFELCVFWPRGQAPAISHAQNVISSNTIVFGNPQITLFEFVKTSLYLPLSLLKYLFSY